MSYLSNTSARQRSLTGNSFSRVPICICIDTSYSMSIKLRDNVSRIDHVNKGVQKFISNCVKDAYAKDSVDLCIVSFGKRAKCEIPFSDVGSIQSEHKFHKLEADGDTSLGAAINYALKLIQDRKDEYQSVGIACYKPWLIIMSDGEATDDISGISKKLRDLVAQRRLKVKCIDMGMNADNGKSSLSRLTPDGSVETLSALDIENFFLLLSRSASELSVSSLGEKDNEELTLRGFLKKQK